MKYIGYLLATALIVALFWTIALFQPMPVFAETKQGLSLDSEIKESSLSQPPQLQAPVSTEKQAALPKATKQPVQKLDQVTEVVLSDLLLAGVSKQIALYKVPELWSEFNSNVSLTQKLIKQPKKIYVFYRKFSADYDAALVTIGYDSGVVDGFERAKAIPQVEFESVLAKAKYSDQQLVEAWKSLDYRKTPLYLVEVHHLALNNQVTGTELLVSYK